MAIVKVIEVLCNSSNSWEDAAQQAVMEASKTLKHIKSIYIKEHSATVNINNKITEYRITANLSFEVNTKLKTWISSRRRKCYSPSTCSITKQILLVTNQ